MWMCVCVSSMRTQNCVRLTRLQILDSLVQWCRRANSPANPGFPCTVVQKSSVHLSWQLSDWCPSTIAVWFVQSQYMYANFVIHAFDMCTPWLRNALILTPKFWPTFLRVTVSPRTALTWTRWTSGYGGLPRAADIPVTLIELNVANHVQQINLHKWWYIEKSSAICFELSCWVHRCCSENGMMSISNKYSVQYSMTCHSLRICLQIHT